MPRLRFSQRRVYHYYRGLVLSRENSDPAVLLRVLNDLKAVVSSDVLVKVEINAKTRQLRKIIPKLLPSIMRLQLKRVVEQGWKA